MNFEKFCKTCGKEMDLSTEKLVITNNLLKRFMNIFQFENMDETINTQALMLSIIINDSYMIIERDGVLRNVWGGLGGELDFYGYPTRYIWSTGTESGDENINDGVVGHSNSLWTPLLPTIIYYADILANLDKSLKIASVNTRLTPMYPATTDSERKTIDSALNDMKNGKSHTYIMKKTLTDLLAEIDGSSNGLTIDLTGHSGDSTYIPMILQAYDNVLARVCRELGINITNVMKKAQVINAEVNGYENYTQIFLDDMLKCITHAFDRVNSRWNRNWKVTLSDPFKDDNPVNVSNETLTDESLKESLNESLNEEVER